MSDQTIIVLLCTALSVTALVIFLAETLRLSECFGALKNAENQARTLDRVIVVKQKSGTVRLSYAVTEKNAAEVAPAPAEIRQESLPPAESVKTQKLTFAEKYENLNGEEKRLIDEFTAYVTGRADCSAGVQANALAYKYKKSLIAKAAIRRGIVVLHFFIVNNQLNSKVRGGNVKIKPLEVRLIGEEDLALAKRAVELAVQTLLGEENARRERRREARRNRALKNGTEDRA